MLKVWVMDLQARKYNLIEYLIALNDETILKKIEIAFLKIKEGKSKKITQQELLNRAMKSNEDYLLGNYKTQEQLERESEKWQ